ncbi:MAG TPA: deoxyribonuclease V [Dehalococcoidia bacterium]|nr:deoxyribonuclease V [Dehalococcoidia bacterium]
MELPVESGAPHRWDLTPREAASLQREMAAQVVARGGPPEHDVRTIAGADVAFDRAHRRGVGAVVALAYPSLEVVEEVSVESAVTFPYVPGLLSFREIPVLLPAFARLRTRPDVLMADGHGYAHPRRFGFACHLGVLLDLPTIGIAKSRLVGEARMPGARRGDHAELLDRGEVIGSVLRTRERVRPIYVSVGHRIGLAQAEEWALRCARRRIPEPTRLADALSRRAKRRMLEATVEMIVEQREGDEGRWEWQEEDERIVFKHPLDPMPAHYGCVEGARSEGDGEMLDVMLAGAVSPERGERLDVRVLDVLERSDGDHKLLAVPAEAPETPLGGVRERIWAWFAAHEKPIVRWGGEERAVAILRDARAWFGRCAAEADGRRPGEPGA